jgi:hypothetical protein
MCALMADTQYRKLPPKFARPFLFSTILPTSTHSAVFSTYAFSGWRSLPLRTAGNCHTRRPDRYITLPRLQQTTDGILQTAEQINQSVPRLRYNASYFAYDNKQTLCVPYSRFSYSLKSKISCNLHSLFRFKLAKLHQQNASAAPAHYGVQ